MVGLDLIELADCVRPEQLIAEILRQNPQMPVPVPVEELARCAGISKIEAFSSSGFEGALIANDTKSDGLIFYNCQVPRPRQRFTIGHELGHFLLPWHRQNSFHCSADDISARANKDWEREANQFSAELLMPTVLLKQRIHSSAEFGLSDVIRVKDEFETSFESTVRRVVELSERAYAVVFSKDNLVRYSIYSKCFNSRLCVRKGSELPSKSLSRLDASSLDSWHELDSSWWLTDAKEGTENPGSIYEQTLVQEDGYKVTLLTYAPA
ncbi:ImmA/IrrE family metallo-endopeptidase [Comamonas sp. w2-DMI]|uniref:ImmA/IrrE family metallo-endopeptidase n=1 Tax=Comamonas sp. w2-DMI TaxID=3126391 RepID=UPI0032E4963D